MGAVGELVREEAERLFVEYGHEHATDAAQSDYQHSAEGFEVRVRPTAGAQVVIAQRLRKTTGKRPDWGASQMVNALIPARERKLEEASLLLEERVVRLLRAHGLA